MGTAHHGGNVEITWVCLTFPKKWGLCGKRKSRTFAAQLKTWEESKRYCMKKLLSLGLAIFATVAVQAGGSVKDAKITSEERTFELSDTSQIVDLDEVVVVAQPKEQVRLRLQPVSSSVFDSEMMNRLQVRELNQLSQYVPSFDMPAYGSRITSTMYMRGIGSRINNTSVGVYYDNIPLMSKSAFNNHFYMLDRVDVLRGPQGTLYGMNTEGGLVRMYSVNPMNYQGTDLHVGIGTGLYTNAEIAHHHRPSERLAFTAAAFWKGLRGFFNNQNFSDKNDKSKEAGGKLRLIYDASQRLRLDWTADYQWTLQNGFAYGEYDAAEDCTRDPATTIMNGYKRTMLNTGLSLSYDMPRLLLTSTTSYQYLKDRMSMDQDYVVPDYLRLEQLQKMNAVTQEIVLRSKPDEASVADEGKWGLLDWQHTTGLFGAYQWLRTDAPVTFGDAITGPISRGVTAAMTSAMKQGMMAGMIQQMMQQGMPEAVAKAAAEKAAQAAVEKAGVNMSAEMAVPEYFHTPQANFSVFHESNILLNERLKLTAGLRLNIDNVKIDYHSLAYMNMTGGTAERQATYHLTTLVENSLSKTYTQLLPKVGLTYRLGEKIGNIYALMSKGYRTGGYNIQMFSDILQADLTANQQKAMRGDYDVPHTDADYNNIHETISYKPEESWSYELGTHLNLCDGRLKADAAVFFTEIRNQQLSVMARTYGYGRVMVNAGKSYSCGAELALRGTAINDHLMWTATYSFTNAKFREYNDSIAVGGRGGEVSYQAVSYKDNYVPFIPLHQLSLTADYRFDTGCRTLRSVTLGANMLGKGKTYWEPDNKMTQDFYATLGAHVALGMGDVTIDIWGRNLTDTNYNTFLVYSKTTNQNFAQRGLPIQVGCDVRVHF